MFDSSWLFGLWNLFRPHKQSPDEADQLISVMFNFISNTSGMSSYLSPSPIVHSDMVREWPRRQAQTQAAMKKERPLEEKVLADVRKRVSQIEKMLKPALENSSLSSNTTKEAERTAHAVAKVCVQSVTATMTVFPLTSAAETAQSRSVNIRKYL